MDTDYCVCGRGDRRQAGMRNEGKRSGKQREVREWVCVWWHTAAECVVWMLPIVNPISSPHSCLFHPLPSYTHTDTHPRLRHSNKSARGGSPKKAEHVGHAGIQVFTHSAAIYFHWVHQAMKLRPCFVVLIHLLSVWMLCFLVTWLGFYMALKHGLHGI